MRGIEAAVRVCMEVTAGAFASESLRKLYPEITSGDRVLAATLAYSTLRRQGLWKHLLIKYCRRDARALSDKTRIALMVGIAGLVELRHFAVPVLINGVLQAIKAGGDEKNVGVANGVLHTVADEAKPYIEQLKKSAELRDIALFNGVPGWAAAQWAKERSVPEAKKMIRANGIKTYLSLRTSQSCDRAAWVEEFNRDGKRCWESPFLENSIRLASNPYLANLPGYSDGKVTPQSESSMLVAQMLAKKWRPGPLLDMCCGRGVKTGQLADACQDAEIEAWDLSQPKLNAAEFEMIRMHAGRRVKFFCGDALELEPKIKPSAILLDAPCTGSGTWARHPDAKWRRECKPEMVEAAASLQKKLLERAVRLIEPGGVIAYATCSVFRAENEEVVASIMMNHPEMYELSAAVRSRFVSKGRPYGIFISPSLPWIDGFYVALLAKRKQA